MTTAIASAPYLRTVHTWSCTGGHSITLDDRGWPQRVGFKEMVRRAWAKFPNDTCKYCGAKTTYSVSTTEADKVPSLPPMSAAAPSPPNHGAAFDAMPCSPGGSVEARREAGHKRRMKKLTSVDNR